MLLSEIQGNNKEVSASTSICAYWQYSQINCTNIFSEPGKVLLIPKWFLAL